LAIFVLTTFAVLYHLQVQRRFFSYFLTSLGLSTLLFLPLFKAFYLTTFNWFLATVLFLLAVFSFSIYQFGFSYLLTRLGFPFFVAYPLVEASRVFFPFDGFPLFNLGEVLVFISPIKGVLHYTTVYGASFLILLTLDWVFKTITHKGRRKLLPLVGVIFLLSVGLFLSQLYLERAKSSPPKGLNFVLVQPFWKEEDQIRNGEKLLPYKVYLINRATSLGKVVLLPESFFGTKDFLNRFMEAFPEGDFIFGKLSVDFNGDRLVALNQVIHISNGKLKEVYTKHKLVPFGEYTPRGFSFLKKLAPYFGGIDFVPGKGERIFSVKGLKIFPLLCSEVFYPLKKKVETLKGVDLVAVFSNDAWFFQSFAFYHLVVVKIRAIETGKPFLFVNSNGYSGLVLPDGTYIGQPFKKIQRITF